jgi:hypothetical protein
MNYDSMAAPRLDFGEVATDETESQIDGLQSRRQAPLVVNGLAPSYGDRGFDFWLSASQEDAMMVIVRYTG